MRVAIDISPSIKGHKVRGTGTYTQNLVKEYEKGKWNIEFEFFENSSNPPPADVVHYPYFDLFFHTLPVKSKSSRVVTIHDVIPLVFPRYFPVGVRGYINLFFQKKFLKNVEAIICDSKTSKFDVANKLSIPLNKIHVIYLAPGENFQKIDSQDIPEKIAKKFSLPKAFVLYVGDVNWHKNIENLLLAVKTAKVNLVMVGSALVDNDLAETQEINKKIKKFSIEDKIQKVGYVSEKDLIALYNLASLTVLPSHYEGFGLPVLESLACGTPVVCSNVASLAEIASPVAIFCDPSDPKDIARQINYVLALDEDGLKKLKEKSVRHASKFTWQKVARQTISVYQKVHKI